MQDRTAELTENPSTTRHSSPEPVPGTASTEHPARPLRAWTMTGTLRQYQADVLARVADADADEEHIIAPPGAGKTLLGLALARRNGRRALALAPTTMIRDQWVAEAHRRFRGPGAYAPPESPAPSARSIVPPPSSGVAGPPVADPPVPGDGLDVSADPASPGDLTVLTYQMLSVVDTASHAFDDLAREAWLGELESTRPTREAATAWLDDLERSNAGAYRKGLRARAARIRKDIASVDTDALARALHPNARALIDRLVAGGVRTIILDECHHLLDHWALVVHLLRRRILEAGGEPLLIGLTATYPDLEDSRAHANYTGLLGDVDFEVPTPAVVREGNLAPYRSWARFTLPTREEIDFLRHRGELLTTRIHEFLASAEGIDFLLDSVAPGWSQGDAPAARALDEGAGATRGATHAEEPGERGGTDRLRACVARGFDADPYLALAATKALRARGAGGAPSRSGPRAASGGGRPPITAADVLALLPPTEDAPDLDEDLTLLGRFALVTLLPDSRRADQWRDVRSVLADFGYRLTDTGIRRSGSPVDEVISGSGAKAAQTAWILRHEFSELGEAMRAVVVTDFAVHGSGKGRARTGGEVAEARAPERGGALRVFSQLAADPTVAALHPVLLTAQHLRVPASDPPVLERLRALTGAPLPATPLAPAPDAGTTDEGGGALVMDVDTAGTTASALVAAASQLVTEGTVRVIVGTRGLLGEGWDCPAVNTLVDLSAVATSAATQQLRGRTLRLDPAWADKVAHNWSVVCLLPGNTGIDASHDLTRLGRKQEHMWGLSLNPSDAAGTLVRGIDNTLGEPHMVALRRARGTVDAGAVNRLNAATEEILVPREVSRRLWAVGGPYSDDVGARVDVDTPPDFDFVSGPTALSVLGLFVSLVVAALGVGALAVVRVFTAFPLQGSVRVWTWWLVAAALGLGGAGYVLWRGGPVVWRLWRSRSRPTSLYPGAARAVLLALQRSGHLGKGYRTDDLRVTVRDRVRVSLEGGSETERVLFADTFAEVFAPIGATRPRWLLLTSHVPEVPADRTRASHPVVVPLARLVNLATRESVHHLAVPRLLGRSKASAAGFADAWWHEVGPVSLCDVSGLAGVDTLVAARAERSTAGLRTRVAQTWG